MEQEAAMSAAAGGKRVLICGGGIIGTCTAYYLAQLGWGSSTTVVECLGVACAASGKAGGFLALDWTDTSPLGALSRKSFALHAELAGLLGPERVGYRPVHTLQVSAFEKLPAKYHSEKPGRAGLPSWLDGNVVSHEVHPARLTSALMEAAQQRGVTLAHGRMEQVMIQAQEDGTQHAAGVVVDGKPMLADVVVLAMGPWTDLVRSQVQQLPRISCLKAHSLVLQPHQPVSDHMLFTNFKYQSGRLVDPEVYPRPDGTVYVCGESRSTPLPKYPAEVQAEEELCSSILTVASSLSSSLAGSSVETKQACYLPTTDDGLPVIGPVPGLQDCYVASGHSCWGILNGPVTGLALAQLIVHGCSTDVDLTPFYPARLPSPTHVASKKKSDKPAA